MEYIELPLDMGIAIIRYFKSNGIELRTEKNGLLSRKFTQEELDQVLELKIDDPRPGCLRGLEHCRNIKSLEISYDNYSAFKDKNLSISDKDISIISKLTSLESLSIIGQNGISWIDVTDLVNLQRLDIERNNSMNLVEGLDQLKNIKEVSIYGNKELYDVKGITDIINNNELDILELDLFNFPEISELATKLFKVPSCQFYETCTSGKDIHYNFSTALLFHKKCLEIEEEILSQNPKNHIDEIILTEKYIAENITYDYDALKRDNRYNEQNGAKRGLNYGTQSAYNGLIFGSCVCEGYTRSMQYLLKLLNIKSKNVYCISGKDKIKIRTDYHNLLELPNDGYHSIIRIEIGDMLYYCDPCWDSCRWHKGDTSLPYCLKNREDIDKDHTLSFEEKGVGGVYSSVSQEYIDSFINKSMGKAM